MTARHWVRCRKGHKVYAPSRQCECGAALFGATRESSNGRTSDFGTFSPEMPTPEQRRALFRVFDGGESGPVYMLARVYGKHVYLTAEDYCRLNEAELGTIEDFTLERMP